MFGRVKIGCFVKHVSLVRKHAESMRKARGNPQHALVLSRQSHPLPAAKGRRTPAHVHGNVQNFPLHHAHKFSLRMLYLIMQAPQNVARRAGMIILHKALGNSRIRHELLVVALEEKSTLVPEYPRFKGEYSGQRSRDFLKRIHRGADGLNCIHQNTFSRKSCSR